MFLDRFFHQRVTDPVAFRLCGFIRMAYALLVLGDRLLLTFDFQEFFLSGMMPYDANSQDFEQPEALFTFFSMIPPDSAFGYWGLHFCGMFMAVLLFLGVFPKLQLIGIHLVMISFHHHNARIWDGEDDMFRMWNLMLFLLPLHHVTLFDTGMFSSKTNDAIASDSWPLWPFRVWQVQLCCIYWGSAFGKLQNPRWWKGHALHHVIHTTDFFGGVFTPSFLFDRVGPLRILTYTSLVLESTCFLVVWWAPRTTVAVMILLHLGIEMSMNMHCFEWLSMLGWLAFLVKADEDVTVDGDDEDHKKQRNSTITKPPLRKRLLITVTVLLGMTLIVYQCIPLEPMLFVFSISFTPTMARLIDIHNTFRNPLPPYLWGMWGWQQESWEMYSGAPSESFYHEARATTASGGTGVVWTSPRWDELNWLQQKRWQRPMTFYDGLEDAGDATQQAFAWYIAKQYNVTTSLQIVKHVYEPVDEFWERLEKGSFGFWDHTKYNVSLSETRLLYVLNICDDTVPDLCQEREERNGCYAGLSWMVDNCRRTCGFCTCVEDLVEGSRLLVADEEDNEFVEGRVHDIRRSKFLLDYGQGYSYEERFEWIDVPTLRSRKFVLLEEKESLEDDRRP